MRDAARDAISMAEGRIARRPGQRPTARAGAGLTPSRSSARLANQISDAAREAAPDIPWVLIINMRHRIVHDYYRIDLDVLWRTVEEEVPDLITRIEPLVPQEESG